MNGNPFVRLETVCASAVERAFALAFPSALEPVQIARKLVAAFEAGPAVAPGHGRRFTVRLHPSDYARLRGDLPYLERQWAAMLARLAERSLRPQRPPDVSSLGDRAIAAGTVTIASETLAAPLRVALRVRTGLPPGAAISLDRTVTVGRDPSCDLVLADPRVSRRHLELTVTHAARDTIRDVTLSDGAGEAGLNEAAGGVRFKDLDSSNGTELNGVQVRSGVLVCGDVLRVGDCELLVAPEGS